MRSIIPLFTLAAAAAAPALAADVVAVPGFRSIELRGGGEVTLRPGPVQRVMLVEGSSAVTRFGVDRNGRLRIDACNRQCPRRYRLRIEIQSPRVPDAGVMGGGSIRAASGFATQSSVSAAVNGGGSIDLRAVNAVRVSAAVNGGGQISVRPRTHLSAAVNGGGLVRYWGNPQVSMAVRGGGLVQRAD